MKWNKDAWLGGWIFAGAEKALGPKEMGAVIARAGVGKTSFLVQLAIEHMLDGHEIFHVAIGHELVQVESHYDELSLSRLSSLNTTEKLEAMQDMARHRAIQAMPPGPIDAQRLTKALLSYKQHLGLKPKLLLVDGMEPQNRESDIPVLAELARDFNLAVWYSMLSTGHSPYDDMDALCPKNLVDLVVVLQSVSMKSAGTGSSTAIIAKLARAFARDDVDGGELMLHPDGLRPMEQGKTTHRRPSDFTLLSGGAQGAEEIFGRCAQERNLTERNFSFAGRQVARTRGLVELTDEELALGDVSWTYLVHRLKRELNSSETMKKVLQTIWHQVNPAGEVFCVGEVLQGGTVKGGTGWAVELAKQQKKPIWVFDQPSSCWYEWFGDDWRACDPPLITQYRFCGTGTRNVTDAGIKAIEELFQRSFGS